MSEKNLASTLASAIVPLGALALAAGCGGGGTSALPQANANNNLANTSSQTLTGTGPSVNATLSITIPARGAQALKRKTPQYISPGSGAVGVTVGTGTQQIFTLPSPGPSPLTTTLPIKAPVGMDTITVSVYDVSPAATASPNVLSKGSTTANISPTALNTPSVTALGVPAGVVLALANNASPAPSATPRPWTPLEHAAVAQSVTINTTAVDALGYTISGALSTAAPIAATGGVTLSAPSVTTASSTVTATYPAGTASAGTVTSSLPLTSGTVAVTPDYGIFVSGTNLDVIDGVDKTVSIAATAVSSGALISAASCTSGAVAVAPAAGAVEIVTLAPSTAANPVPTATASSLPVPNATASSAVVFDATCNAYVSTSTGGNYVIDRISGFGGTPQVGTFATIAAIASTNASPLAGVVLSVAGTSLYAGEFADQSTAPYATGATYAIPLAGGTATQIDTNVAESLATSGTTIYTLWDLAGTSSGCAFSGPNLQDLQAAQTLQSNAANDSLNAHPLIAAADGTLFGLQGSFFGQAVYSTATPLAASSFQQASGAPSGNPGTTLVGMTLSPDPANAFGLFALSTGGTYTVTPYPRATTSFGTPAASIAIGTPVTGLAAAP
jgi:hypothetical protein